MNNTKATVSFQGTVGAGAEIGGGISADLSLCAGQTVNITFAAVPRTDPTGLCILAHVTGVKVEAPADDETDDETDDEPTNDS